MESVYSKRIRAGKRRTYFFDVRATRSNDYYLTITESRKKFNEDGYDRHKIFLYKEDFNKFLKALTEAVDYVKTELMPDFDFDAYNHDTVPEADGAMSGGGSHEHTHEHTHENTHEGSHQGSSSPVAEEEEEITHSPAPVAASAPTSNTASANGEDVDKW
jgi:Protein of unknown function (DUF3276)